MPRDYSLEAGSTVSHQRRRENARDDSWIRALLRRGQVAHIGTRWDDQPFVTPTNYIYLEAGHQLVFHSNVVGRLRSNIERHPKVSAEVSEVGRLLPSNVALEFSVQYRSVMVFGEARVVTEPEEQQRLLHALIAKYFPGLEAGRDYRPATAKELRRTTVYALHVAAWSGKENWQDHAEQSNEWPALDSKWLE